MNIKNLIRQIKKLIKEPRWIIILLDRKGIRLLNDKNYLKMMYKCMLNKKLDLKNPKTFNEKLQWLKLYDRNPNYTILVDKYEVKKYIEKTIGKEYVIPTIGIWDNFEDINFEKLPQKFVMKCTHDSGGVIICKDKLKLNKKTIKRKIIKKLKNNYYYYGREYPYKNVKPRIIIEEYMEDNSAQELKDYKFMCYNGKVKCSFVCTDRFSADSLKVTFFDTNWEKMPFERHYPASKENIKKPKNYDKMIKIAEKLSKNIPFVRVDLYEINNKIYFGELTFYPGSGFEEFTPNEWDYKLGEWIKIPKLKGK